MSRRAFCGGLGGLAALAMLVEGCSSRRVSASLLPPHLSLTVPAMLWAEPFDTVDSRRWREIAISGHTQFQPAVVDAQPCLQARSEAGASILLTAIRFHPTTYPWFSWRWRVDQLVEAEALERKEGSDAAARVYVYFDTEGLPWQRRNLDYVWSATLPVGTVLESPYSASSKIIVTESGSAFLGQWRSVERNLEEDYRRCFGQAPPRVVAIGLMSDSDNTQGHSLAYFDDLRITRSSGGVR